MVIVDTEPGRDQQIKLNGLTDVKDLNPDWAVNLYNFRRSGENPEKFPSFYKYVSHWNVILSHANFNCRVGNELWYDVKRGQKRIGTSEGTIHFLTMLLLELLLQLTIVC